MRERKNSDPRAAADACRTRSGRSSPGSRSRTTSPARGSAPTSRICGVQWSDRRRRSPPARVATTTCRHAGRRPPVQLHAAGAGCVVLATHLAPPVTDHAMDGWHQADQARSPPTANGSWLTRAADPTVMGQPVKAGAEPLGLATGDVADGVGDAVAVAWQQRSMCWSRSRAG
jgi:hypothetical protein